ncbi:MAG: recombinase family protein, partial [Candidatus Eisenbacteria bacterium]|nr:recombinase family protein [Candidatus Eisenbacteria bacterium]
AGVWWPGRVGLIIRNTTYKGVHYFGRRAKRIKEPIKRQVPAIVSEEIWDKAQKTLKRNLMNSPRGAKRRYLLRSLIKCGICGLNFGGLNDHNDTPYYRCGGKRKLRGIYGKTGEPCRSKYVPLAIEDMIWADLEEFLRNPGDVLKTLAENMDGLEDDDSIAKRELELIQEQLKEKDIERGRILNLYRRGTIDTALLDHQMADIETERQNLTQALVCVRERLGGVQAAATRIDSAEALLSELNGRLDGTLTWELKREIVETLVEGIIVETVEKKNGKKEAIVHVTYCFDKPNTVLTNYTDSRASRKQGIKIDRSGKKTNTCLTNHTQIRAIRSEQRRN